MARSYDDPNKKAEPISPGMQVAGTVAGVAAAAIGRYSGAAILIPLVAGLLVGAICQNGLSKRYRPLSGTVGFRPDMQSG